jgi:hypothetical protein
MLNCVFMYIHCIFFSSLVFFFFAPLRLVGGIDSQCYVIFYSHISRKSCCGRRGSMLHSLVLCL